MCHQQRLRVLALHRNKPHRGAGYRFADCLGIGRICLAALDVALYVAWLHQPHVMAKLAKFARPVMRTCAGFHADQTGWLTLKELKHLAASELTAQRGTTLGVNTVQLENRLRQIDPDCGNLVHGWLPLLAVFTAPNMAHCDAGNGSHPLHQWPAPGPSLGRARRRHDRVGADTVGAEQYDPGTPDMLLSRVAIPDQRLKPLPIRLAKIDEYSSAHAPDSHAQSKGIQPELNPLDHAAPSWASHGSWPEADGRQTEFSKNSQRKRWRGGLNVRSRPKIAPRVTVPSHPPPLRARQVTVEARDQRGDRIALGQRQRGWPRGRGAGPRCRAPRRRRLRAPR